MIPQEIKMDYIQKHEIGVFFYQNYLYYNPREKLHWPLENACFTSKAKICAETNSMTLK